MCAARPVGRAAVAGAEPLRLPRDLPARCENASITVARDARDLEVAAVLPVPASIA